MSEKLQLQDGQTIVFLGDSITEAPDGYVKIFEQMLGALAPNIRVKCINSGVGGNRVTDMLDRIGDDAIWHDPDWITVSVGINDVWHGINGTRIDLFKDKYEEMVIRLAKQSVAKLILFTTTVIGEDLDSEANGRLVEYNDFIRETAKKRKAALVDMNQIFNDAISQWHEVGTELKFTTDGVHMTPAGDYLMAVNLLKVWNLL